MVELATFERPYRRRTLGAANLPNIGAWRAAIGLYLGQAAAAGITERYEQIIYALEKLENTANLSVMLSQDFKDYIYSLGTQSARGFDEWAKRRSERLAAIEESRARQAEAAAKAASEQAAAIAEARKRAEASRAEQAERAQAQASEQAGAFVEAVTTQEQADAEAAAAIIDAEAAAAVSNMENTIDAAQKGKATPEQVEQAAAVAVEAVQIQAKKDAFSRIVPLTIAAGLFILILRKV